MHVQPSVLLHKQFLAKNLLLWNLILTILDLHVRNVGGEVIIVPVLSFLAILITFFQHGRSVETMSYL